MPRIGDDLLDAVAAFAGAASAGIALFLPFTFGARSEVHSAFHVTSLLNSVPRAAALGLIVAMVVAVLARPITRPGLIWLTAAGGAAALALNYFIGTMMRSADVLTSQNYLDSLCGGVLFGALGIVALRRRWSAVGFMLGTVLVFVYGEVVGVFSSTDSSLEASYTPAWLVGTAVVLLAVNALRHRHGIMLPAVPRLAADLPISPIVAATVLSVSVLLATEWLAREWDGRNGSTWQIAVAVAVTVIAAFVAATLLPGRDGGWLLVAVGVAAAGDALGDAARLGWYLLLVLGLGAVTILGGLRRSSPLLAMLAVGALCVFAALAPRLPWSLAWPIGAVALACLAGYTAGSIRYEYLPSAVLALGALYLPSILWSIPTRHRDWPTAGTPAAESLPGRAGLAVTLGVALALALLYLIRPQRRATATEQ
ncbi:hypothetical protein [Nocardia asteroides]|uniref:hypothetical protein n=1 Tax=Nocardia asteroides TaxID=1824 RepID=UPI001E4D096A|nr:hypothetical protein [Nocardia asteroides]UGT58162.1 hypothetical protein LTT85_15565 [Nocardia asteroides]